MKQNKRYWKKITGIMIMTLIVTLLEMAVINNWGCHLPINLTLILIGSAFWIVAILLILLERKDD